MTGRRRRRRLLPQSVAVVAAISSASGAVQLPPQERGDNDEPGFGMSGFVQPNPTPADLKICSVLGGLDLTRLRSAEVRSTLEGAVEDVELIREVVTESMRNGGIRGGLSNLTEMGQTLNWKARRDRANELLNWTDEEKDSLSDSSRWWYDHFISMANLTEEDTTLTAGLGWADDRGDRRVERFVNETTGPDGGGPYMETKEADMGFVDTASNLLPWLLDRRSRRHARFLTYQNIRGEQHHREPLPYDRLYKGVQAASLSGAVLRYPPHQKLYPDPATRPITYADVEGGESNILRAFSNLTPPGWPTDHKVPPGVSIRDPILSYPYIYTDEAGHDVTVIAAVSPIYYTGEWRGRLYDDEIIGFANANVLMSAVAWIFDDLEDGLCEGSFGLLADANTFDVMAISDSVMKRIFPEGITLKQILGERVGDGELKNGIPLHNVMLESSARWDELLRRVNATARGERDYHIMNITLTGENAPREYYVMFDRWAYMADYVMLVFAPVEGVHGAVMPVLSASEIKLDILAGSTTSEAVTVTNNGTLNLTISLDDHGMWGSGWMTIANVEKWMEGVKLGPGESADVLIDVNTRGREHLNESVNILLDVIDDGYPDCTNITTRDIRVSVRASPEPNLNQLESWRIFGFVLCFTILATATGFAAWVVWFRKNQVVRSSQPEFLILICTGCFVMGCTLIPMSIDDGVTSTDGAGRACMAVPWLFFMGFVITFSALFSKIWRINKIFHQSSFKKITVKATDVIIPFAILSSLNFVFLLCWTLVDPLKFHREPTGDWWDSYGKCYEEGQAWIAFLTLIAVTDITALILACIQAYRARDISDEFSETKYITITLAGMLQVFLIGIPLIALITEPTTTYFVLCMMVFLVSMSVLLLMFVPKMIYMKKKNKKSRAKKDDALARVMKNAANGVEKAAAPTESIDSTESSNGTAGIRVTHCSRSVVERQLKETKGEAEALKKQVLELTNQVTRLKGVLEQHGICFDTELEDTCRENGGNIGGGSSQSDLHVRNTKKSVDVKGNRSEDVDTIQDEGECALRNGVADFADDSEV